MNNNHCTHRQRLSWIFQKLSVGPLTTWGVVCGSGSHLCASPVVDLPAEIFS